MAMPTTVAPPARPRRLARDLVTKSVQVDGRRVSYAVGGRGLPVVFLHGWGLDHAAYGRSLRRLTARGCRVVAPSMPGFGSSDELPFMERTLPGYAAWVERFLDALGLDEPVLILGHSFGGGIATRFAHDHPERVRYLVLLNSVGDPRAMGASGLTTRLPGLGSLKSMIDTFRPAEDLATTGLMQRTLLANMRRHPFTVMQSAQAAFFADLRTEMAALAARELPVLVLWSDDDRMIPLTAFDTFCSTFGTDGQVVHGGHSWLLADPEVFGEVLDNVIQVQGGEHGARAATANVEVLRDLLSTTSLPRPVVSKLLDGVSPLWALSESPEVLAADLVLCHPPVADGEVRAVARELPGSGMFRLTVVAHDRPGFLADTTAVLAATGASVEGASVMTWPERGLALHAVTVHSPHGIDADSWDEIGSLLRASVVGEVPATFIPSGRARVTRTGGGQDTTMVRVTAPDDVGLLSAICRWFADHGLSIEAAGIATDDGVANDVFLVDGEVDTKQLEQHLSRPAGHSCARLLRLLR